MPVENKHFRTIWEEKGGRIFILDQTRLPFHEVTKELKTLDDACRAIADMEVRGAGLIGVTAGYGMYIAGREAAERMTATDTFAFNRYINEAGGKLRSTRPTAVNLAYAVDRQLLAISCCERVEDKVAALHQVAKDIHEADTDCCKRIGENGLTIIKMALANKGGKEPLNIMTHCNAGALAFSAYGSATAPIYAADAEGLNVHVWVSETRPRNQGGLTAWEMRKYRIPHTVIADNEAGHLMQHGMVDLIIVGTDRTTRTGDVANKIGTYLKAVAAKDNGVPFFVALPSTTFDWNLRDGMDIPIEQRNPGEVRYVTGMTKDEWSVDTVCLYDEKSPCANYAFDVTPARLVTGLITERGVCDANEEAILRLFPERRIEK
ncbi:S-methyl-5-thioribose-1-phosphate isomerase [Candidatus Woesearchaeota archaeon]|nr:S-methyl-5-thioribose-1-phosphate isomerase [Candidatus Woesearchaeota archaeon]